MHAATRLLAALLLVSVIGVGVAGGTAVDVAQTDGTGVASADATFEGAATATAETRPIELDQEFRTTSEPGRYAVSHRYRIPEEVSTLEVTLPAAATVESRSGFRAADGTTYAWDGSTARPELTYQVPANRTREADGPIAGPGRYLFADTGDWALVTRPQVSHNWGWYGTADVTLERETTAETGAVGEVMAFLGPHEEHVHRAHGQTFRLVVPEAATLAEEPDEILASLADASGALRVGSRDEEVFVVAAPTGEVGWGVRGLQTGAADVWVRDSERLDTADNVWLHEYVHTRQGYRASEDLRWFTEGSAVYYAALLSLEQDRIDYEAFRARLERGTERRFDGVRLAEPDSWVHTPDYHLGALVAGELDRQLRLATDGEATLQEPFRRLNAHDGTVTAARFEQALRATGGIDVARQGVDYTRDTERPTTWDRTAHAEAFGVAPARIEYDIPTEPRVSGPSRNVSAGDERPIVMVPGETLALEVRVTNTGGTTGAYEAVVRLEDAELDRRSGRLEPGASATLPVEHEFDAVGEDTLSVGDRAVPVTVLEPADARVTALAADRTTVPAGTTITLSATVENDADRPGTLDAPVTRDGTVVDRVTVDLEPDAERTVTLETTVDRPGEHVFELGDASTTVTVTDAEGTPGFGPAVAVVAVAFLSVAIALRRR